jgi:hypothetical protein
MSLSQDTIKIFVCYNKPWAFPKEPIYVPIQSGKSLSDCDLGILGDNTTDNISQKNEIFGEFTAWYWVWRNLNILFPNGLKYIGLSHYRRFFSFYASESGVIDLNIMPPMKQYEKKIFHILNHHQIILAKPWVFSQPLYKQFTNSHPIRDYHILKEVMHNLYPEYDCSFAYVMEETNQMSCYCMFISSVNFFNEYFKWLFTILFAMEERIDISAYDGYEKRVLAFLAERLLNVYVYHNKLDISFQSIFFLHNCSSGLRYIRYFAIYIKEKVKSIYKKFVPLEIRIVIGKVRGKSVNV